MTELEVCLHPEDNVTWTYKGGGQVILVNGLLLGTCDLCGAEVACEAKFNV